MEHDKWRENEINDLLYIVESVKNGKVVRRTNHWRKDILDQIHEECDN